MSRVGNKLVQVPAGVDVIINGNNATVKGKLGELKADIHPLVNVEYKDNSIFCSPVDESKIARSMWGTTRNLLNGVVVGVSEGFKKNLEIIGVGYRAQVQDNSLVLQLGYSHEVNYPIPAGIKISCPKNTSVVIEGIDKQLVGQVAAEIREFRKPEPYKGKGIRYENEFVVRKEGKKK